MKKNLFHKKIPTVLGLFLVLCLLTAQVNYLPGGSDLKGQVLSLTSKSPQSEIKNIQITNISPEQFTLTWQTDIKTPSKVSWGKTPSTSNTSFDDQDSPAENKNYLFHNTTLKNLDPNTQYSFKISGSSKPHTFKTPKPQKSLNLNPIIGKIFDIELNPLTDSQIFLIIPGTINLSTTTTSSGNFLVPLNYLLKNNLSSSIDLTTPLQATLQIISADSSSEVKLTLPQKDPLPPIIIGQNYDFSQKFTTKKITASTDFNSDGKTNTIDLARIISEVNKKTSDKKYDLNSDGEINQKDIDIVKENLR